MNSTKIKENLNQLLNFVGFGRLDAEIWFLGMQDESGGEEYNHARLKFDQIEDLAEVHHILADPAQISEDSPSWMTWQSICHIMLRLHGKDQSADAIRSYLSEHLGRTNGTTLLCYLMPFPDPDSQDWAYDSLITEFESRQAFYENSKARRLELFRELLGENHPKTIVAYGKKYWDEYKVLFNNIKFSTNGSFEAGWDADTVVILTDEFTAPGMQEKLDELTTIILENSLSIETPLRPGANTLSLAEEKRLKKEAAKQTAAARRKPSAKHNPADPYCVCEYCLGYEAGTTVKK